MNDESMDKLLTICSGILRELEILSSTTKASILAQFQKDFFNTSLQKKIFNAIDGAKSTQEIADSTNASIRAVQLLIKDLKEQDLVSEEKLGRSTIPNKNIGQIAAYCSQHNLGESKDE